MLGTKCGYYGPEREEGRGTACPGLRSACAGGYFTPCLSLHSGECHRFIELDVRGLIVLEREAADDDGDDEVDCKPGMIS